MPYSLLQECEGIIKRLKRKLLFAAEMVINASLLQSCCLHQIGKRRTKVAALTEELGRPCKNHLSCLFPFAHRLLLHGRKRIQVVVACAYSLPAASVRRASAVATRPPIWITFPSQYTAPVVVVMGRR